MKEPRDNVILPDNANLLDGIVPPEQSVTKPLPTAMPDEPPTSHVVEVSFDAGHAPDATRPPHVTQVVVDGKAVRVYGMPLRVLRGQPGMLDAPEIVVPGLTAIARVTLLAAREKVGKSTYAAFVAVQVSTGGTINGQRVKQGVVLWVGLEEDQSDAVRRFEAMGGDRDHLVLLDRLHGPGGFAQLKAEVLAHKPRLIILDSLARYSSDSIEDENNATGWNREFTNIMALARESRAAILILHHANRATGSYRGSTAIGAAVDMIVEMAVSPSDQFVRTFNAKGRWWIDAYSCRYDPVNSAFAMTDAPADAAASEDEKLDSVKAQVLEWITLHPGSGKKRLREAIGKRAASVDAAIDALVAEQRIVYLGRTEGYRLPGVPDGDDGAAGA